MAARAQVRALAAEMIDATDFPDEALEVWAAGELRTLAPADGPGGPGGRRGGGVPQVMPGMGPRFEGLAGGGRAAAVWLLRQLTDFVGLTSCQSQAQAVTLLDIYMNRQKGLKDSDVLVACSAIASILSKVDSSFMQVGQGMMQREVAKLAKWLGLPEQTVTELRTQHFRTFEEAFLGAVGWEVAPMTAEAWMLAYGARLDAGTFGLFTQSIEWMLQHGLPIVQLLHQHASVFELPPPQRLARGVLALGVAAANLLPLDIMRPSDIDSDAWAALYAWTQWGCVPRCNLSQQCWKAMLELVKVGLGVETEEEVKEDARLFAEAARDIFTGSD